MKYFWLPKNKLGFDRISLTHLNLGDCLFLWPQLHNTFAPTPIMMNDKAVYFGFQSNDTNFQINIPQKNSVEGGSTK